MTNRELCQIYEKINDLRLEKRYWEEAQIRAEKYWNKIILKTRSKLKKETAQECFTEEYAKYDHKIASIEAKIYQIRKDNNLLHEFEYGETK